MPNIVFFHQLGTDDGTAACIFRKSNEKALINQRLLVYGTIEWE